MPPNIISSLLEYIHHPIYITHPSNPLLTFITLSLSHPSYFLLKFLRSLLYPSVTSNHLPAAMGRKDLHNLPLPHHLHRYATLTPKIYPSIIPICYKNGGHYNCYLGKPSSGQFAKSIAKGSIMKFYYYNPPPTPDNEMEAAIQEFLNRGGKIQNMRCDDGSYDKALKKTQSNLKGGFNPFSKDQALTINKDD